MRLAYSSVAFVAAPYASPILRSVSHSSGKLNLNFSANFRFSSGVSKLTPRMRAFFCSYSPARSRNPEPSRVQPGVSAFG